MSEVLDKRPTRASALVRRLRTTSEVVSRLGAANVATVLSYRIAVRSGAVRRLLPARKKPVGHMFRRTSTVRAVDPSVRLDPLLEEAAELRAGRFRMFFGEAREVGAPPDWFRNAYTRATLPATARDCHWTSLDEFALSTGDIKTLWELSRFEWAPLLARAYAATGDESILDTLNAWVRDWCERNPVNVGPNWRCGQEASLRLLNLLLAAEILDQLREPPPELVDFAADHCSRIRPTIRYALAQDNNHGTSEAAALFVGGAFLANCAGVETGLRQKARRWERRGRVLLEGRVKRLFQEDGSFAQHSVIYHRFALDTLSMAEHWRRRFGRPVFSSTFLGRARAATDWLFQLTDAETGEAPNLGANDGSRFFRLCSSPYGDHRSSIQLASTLFLGGTAFREGPWDEPLFWLGYRKTEPMPAGLSRASRVFEDGGYVTLSPEGDDPRPWGLVRFPRFRFRPSHADAMHLDLWFDGMNVLRDGGSFSYADPDWHAYFSGTVSHNTIQFDGRDQMPRISRFLFGSWLEPSFVGPLEADPHGVSWTGEYCDPAGARHRRTVRLERTSCKVTDEIEGYDREAVLRWRLLPSDWRLEENGCSSPVADLRISSDVPLRRMVLATAWESKFYMARAEIPCLEVTVGPPGAVLETTIALKG